MGSNIRKTGRRNELDALWQRHNSILLLLAFSTFNDGAIGNGTTAGNLRTTVSVDYRIAGVQAASKASTDDLWDLSAEADTTAAQFRAYWLYLDSAGAASIAAGSNQTTAALALENLPALDETKSIIGVYVAGVSTDFDDAGGLAAQGTIYDGIPAGAPCGVPGKTYVAPELATLVGY